MLLSEEISQRFEPQKKGFLNRLLASESIEKRAEV
jgi:hypothetical protein